MKNIKFLILGTLFGIVLVKAEVISWFRIQEMFRFESFHMYGIIGSAILVGIISIQLIKYFKIKSIKGEELNPQPKKFTKNNFYGGLFFGLGWSLIGACPGPLYALLGAGNYTIIVALLFAILGVWFYGSIKNKLPH